MTNLPRNRLRALDAIPPDIVEPPGGHIMIGQSVTQQVAWNPLEVAERMASTIQVGANFPVRADERGQPMFIEFPDLGPVLDKAAAALPPGDDTTDRLALLSALWDFQRATAVIIARFVARHAAADPDGLTEDEQAAADVEREIATRKSPPASNGHAEGG